MTNLLGHKQKTGCESLAKADLQQESLGFGL